MAPRRRTHSLILTCSSTILLGSIRALDTVLPLIMRGTWYDEKCPFFLGKIVGAPLIFIEGGAVRVYNGQEQVEFKRRSAPRRFASSRFDANDGSSSEAGNG
jgi:hypothetical protein